MIKRLSELSLVFALALTFGCSPSESCDSSFVYEGKTYKTVKLGKQVWMAENLNYAAPGSKCYNDLESNCEKYGRLYDWSTAMALPDSCNLASCVSQVNEKHRGVCPSGWHIPSYEEWDTLAAYIEKEKGCTRCDAKHLKTTSEWNEDGNGLDSYGFSALPGGMGYFDVDFEDIGDYGLWWSATEFSSDEYAYLRGMGYYHEFAYWDYYYKLCSYSIRCLQDNN